MICWNASLSARRGFSLIEVLVAIVLVVWGVAAVWNMLDRAVWAQMRLSRRASAYHVATAKAIEAAAAGYDALEARLNRDDYATSLTLRRGEEAIVGSAAEGEGVRFAYEVRVTRQPLRDYAELNDPHPALRVEARAWPTVRAERPTGEGPTAHAGNPLRENERRAWIDVYPPPRLVTIEAIEPALRALEAARQRPPTEADREAAEEAEEEAAEGSATGLTDEVRAELEARAAAEAGLTPPVREVRP